MLLRRSIEIECTSWGEVGRDDGDLVGRSIELDGTVWGNFGQREVGLGVGKHSRGLLSSTVPKGRLR